MKQTTKHISQTLILPHIQTKKDQFSTNINTIVLPRRHSITDNIQKFQKIITRTPNKSKQTTYKKQNKKYKFKTQSNQVKMHKQIKLAQNQILKLRQQIKNKNKNNQSKLDNLISVVQNCFKNQQRPYNSIAQQPRPIFYPIPLPYPAPQTFQNVYKKRQPRYNKLKRHSFRNNTSHKRYNLLRIFKKYALAVWFLFIFKKFCSKIQQFRKIKFMKFISIIQQRLKNIRRNIIMGLRQFLSVILEKSQISFDLSLTDGPPIIKQKIIGIKKLVGVVLESLQQVIYQNINKIDWVQSFYFLCKHGNYSCQQPLLTKQQLEITCISPHFKYISADSHLQKSSIINILFVKLLLYNTLLSPSQLDKKFQNKIVTNNLFVISSVIYELVLDLQDDYAQNIPDLYKIGNYKKYDFVKGLRSICVNESQQIEGQLISGLYGQQWCKKYIKLQSMQEQKQIVKQIVQIIHEKMVKYHETQRDKIIEISM